MSRYSIVSRKIGADEWVRNLPRNAQLLWFWILTGTHVTPVPGLWSVTREALRLPAKFTAEEFDAAWQTITETVSANGSPRAVADWENGLIWLPNAIEFRSNQPANPNVVRGWFDHLELVPECDLKWRAVEALKSWISQKKWKGLNGLLNGFPNRSGNRCRNGSANGFPNRSPNGFRSGTGTGTGTGERDSDATPTVETVDPTEASPRSLAPSAETRTPRPKPDHVTAFEAAFSPATDPETATIARVLEFWRKQSRKPHDGKSLSYSTKAAMSAAYRAEPATFEARAKAAMLHVLRGNDAWVRDNGQRIQHIWDQSCPERFDDYASRGAQLLAKSRQQGAKSGRSRVSGPEGGSGAVQ